ncbi:hypothetical protein [Amycolatopsis sp. 195334CR]|nr:hypothetical protein [Amycolatopsis sp. 195334CR]MBN6039112.1 hypothetical protein [Amycolatopsis sp. 195334CR]
MTVLTCDEEVIYMRDREWWEDLKQTVPCLVGGLSTYDPNGPARGV